MTPSKRSNVIFDALYQGKVEKLSNAKFEIRLNFFFFCEWINLVCYLVYATPIQSLHISLIRLCFYQRAKT